MAGAFPTLSFGGTVQYPLTLKVSCLTRIQKALNSETQRYVMRAPMAELVLTYTNLTDADRSSVESFHDSQKGAYDSTWTLDFDSKSLTAMRFSEDLLTWEENIPNRWTTRLKCSGLYPIPGSPPASLPALDSGAVTQMPWSKEREYDTSFTDMESGVRHATALRGGGLTNYPTGPELRWNLEFHKVAHDKAEEVIQFFVSKRGRFGSFSFTDPDSLVVYSGCYFGSDDLTVTYNGYGNTSLTAQVVKL